MVFCQNVNLIPFVYNTSSHKIEKFNVRMYGDINVTHHFLSNPIKIEKDEFNLAIYDRQDEIVYLAQSIDFDYE